MNVQFSILKSLKLRPSSSPLPSPGFELLIVNHDEDAQQRTTNTLMFSADFLRTDEAAIILIDRREPVIMVYG